MDQNLINIINVIVGYVIVINIIGISLIWIKTKTKNISLSNGKLNVVLTIIALLGGFIGVLVGAEMIGYEQGNKLFKRWIPIFLFIETCIVMLVIYNNYA